MNFHIHTSYCSCWGIFRCNFVITGLIKSGFNRRLGITTSLTVLCFRWREILKVIRKLPSVRDLWIEILIASPAVIFLTLILCEQTYEKRLTGQSKQIHLHIAWSAEEPFSISIQIFAKLLVDCEKVLNIQFFSLPLDNLSPGDNLGQKLVNVIILSWWGRYEIYFRYLPLYAIVVYQSWGGEELYDGLCFFVCVLLPISLFGST